MTRFRRTRYLDAIATLTCAARLSPGRADSLSRYPVIGSTARSTATFPLCGFDQRAPRASCAVNSAHRDLPRILPSPPQAEPTTRPGHRLDDAPFGTRPSLDDPPPAEAREVD